MRKTLLFTLLAIFAAINNGTAQTNCDQSRLTGIWKECGIARSNSYSRPPANVNTDSLLAQYKRSTPAGKIWTFGADGSYSYESPAVQLKNAGRYTLTAATCALKLSTRKRDPFYIMHLTDSAMITWHNTPKTAYLTVYRR